MESGNKTVMNWSSGKDAALAFHMLCFDKTVKLTHLLTTMSAGYNRVFMHGIREELLDLQTNRIGIPHIKIKLPESPDDGLYQQAIKKTLLQLKNDGVTHAAFGDIFLEDLRAYREEQLKQVAIQGVFPLWKRDTRALISEISGTGIKAIVVCVSGKHLGKEFLGRKIDNAFLNDLPAGVDPCGENGEFHTFVYDAPFFNTPINIKTGEIVHRIYQSPANDNPGWDKGFYFLDVLPD